jgi:hypothetical protein
LPRAYHGSDEAVLCGLALRKPQEVDALMAGIAATGWHEYFTTTQAVGAMDSMAQHLADLAAL